MTEMNLFASLKLDFWYKALIPFGGILALISIFYSPSIFTQKELFVLGSGLFLLGLGEWKNQGWINWEQTASAFTPYVRGSTPKRMHTKLGNLLDVIAILAIIVGLASFFNVMTLP